jgi:preprotein translocase subunit Sec61beta
VRFYQDESAGFQIGPEAVLASSLVFIGIVVVLHIIGKFTS